MSAARVASTSMMPPEDDPRAGLPFSAVRRLGGGSTGEVFLAEHRQLGKVCAVKVLHPRFAGNQDLEQRFLLAARALGHLKSPNIVSVTGAGITRDERPFIVMEFLEGRTVADELASRGSIPLQHALGWTCQLLQALGAAHASGIVHRDIRPENLFLYDSPEGSRTLKVVDFGLTRILPNAPPGAPHPLPVPTDANTVVGSPRYISPEGAQGQPVDHRADLYSAALVLYTMVTGHGPFDHQQDEDALLFAHATEAAQPPSRFMVANAVPPELDSALLRALRKDPSERFQTADEFREALERIREGLTGAPPSEPELRELDGAAITLPPRSGRVRAIPRAAAKPLPSPLISTREALFLFVGTAVLAAVVAIMLGILRAGR